MKVVLAGAVLLALAAPAAAADGACGPLSSYSVVGVGVEDAPVAEAMQALFFGTPWTVKVNDDVAAVQLSYRGVSGPLDRVLMRSVQQASNASGQQLAAGTDQANCLITIRNSMPVKPATEPVAAAVHQEASAPVAAPAAPTGPRPGVLKSGTRLSESLEQYVKEHGWEMRWLVDQDFMLDMDLPIPAVDVVDGVAYVIRAYQSKGGMTGVTPKFYRGNRVVAIEVMRAEANSR